MCMLTHSVVIITIATSENNCSGTSAASGTEKCHYKIPSEQIKNESLRNFVFLREKYTRECFNSVHLYLLQSHAVFSPD